MRPGGANGSARTDAQARPDVYGTRTRPVSTQTQAFMVWTDCCRALPRGAALLPKYSGVNCVNSGKKDGICEGATCASPARSYLLRSRSMRSPVSRDVLLTVSLLAAAAVAASAASASNKVTCDQIRFIHNSMPVYSIAYLSVLRAPPSPTRFTAPRTSPPSADPCLRLSRGPLTPPPLPGPSPCRGNNVLLWHRRHDPHPLPQQRHHV